MTKDKSVRYDPVLDEPPLLVRRNGCLYLLDFEYLVPHQEDEQEGEAE